MICSLNQIEQTARKAVRGAGLPWGLADDAGKAVRWLHIYGVNGVPALAALLARHDYSNPAALAPVALSGVWRAPGGTLDPLLAGASLSDCLDRAEEAPIETGVIAHPILAAGFIGNAAEIEDHAFILSWPDVRLCCRRGGVWLAGAQRAVETETAGFLTCRPSGDDERDFPGQHRTPQITEADVAPEPWARLEQYAHRTYVEATDASRIAGAGAGLHDND